MSYEWTPSAIEELKQLCFDEKSNSDIATYFAIPLSEVYAKRSQLGITIDKVNLAKKGMLVNKDFEAAVCDMEKMNFVKDLETLLKKSDCDVTKLSLSENGEIVTIHFIGGGTKRANIACDSKIAIIRDVARAVG